MPVCVQLGEKAFSRYLSAIEVESFVEGLNSVQLNIHDLRHSRGIYTDYHFAWMYNKNQQIMVIEYLYNGAAEKWCFATIRSKNNKIDKRLLIRTTNRDGENIIVPITAMSEVDYLKLKSNIVSLQSKS